VGRVLWDAAFLFLVPPLLMGKKKCHPQIEQIRQIFKSAKSAQSVDQSSRSKTGESYFSL
jgi:hypothetical protein